MAATDRTERHDATAVETEEPETFDTATDSDGDALDVAGYAMKETVERLNRIRTGDDDPVTKARAVNAVSDIVAADHATNALIANPGNDKTNVLNEGRLRAVITMAITSMTNGEFDGFAKAVDDPDTVGQLALRHRWTRGIPGIHGRLDHGDTGGRTGRHAR